MSPDLFRFEAPALPEYLGAARAFVAALAREQDAPVELVADLKLATSEACALAIAAGDPIRVRAMTDQRTLEVEVDLRGDGGIDGSDVDRRELIGALFPGAAFVDRPDGSRALRFVAGLAS